ncbi:aldehyde dehydrogenase family protein [Streptomyces sp. NPDC058385]|uniref:aldehyde dehydrogenase family protein n=1 Tax=Streptomyces sp. NPDC058385 TaxID=3346473 RepID=UPI003655E8E4
MTFTVRRPKAGTAPLINADELPPLGHFIDGKFTEPGPELTDVLDPATEELLARVPLGTVEDADHAVAAARAAHPAWARITPKERADLLLAIAERVDANANLLVHLESADTGKPFAVSRDDISMTADGFRFMAGALRATGCSLASGEYVADHTSLMLREPLGVIGAVTPWNYPLLMGAWKIAPILAAGNCLVLKPSEQTPLSTLKFAELVADLLPAGVFNVVTGRGSVVGDRLARHPDIAMIALTGSTGSGQAVARAAADTVKRAHLELGGKAPFVVFEDADLKAAAEGLRTAGFWNSGQECGAACRVLVHASVAEEFTAHVVREIEQITVGDPRADEAIEIGPLVSKPHYDRVRGYLGRAISAGARPVVGGAALEEDKPGYFVAPTVLVDVAEGAEITREEVFGPVVSIETFTEEDEAIRRANDVDAGLAASVWTENARRSHAVAAGLDAGTVWVNSHLVLANELPWGGFKGSGYGRDLSVYALEDYSRTKHVMHNHGR